MSKRKIFILSAIFIIIMCSASYAENSTVDKLIQAFNGKRIAVPVGSAHVDIVKRTLPDSQIFYLDVLANMIQDLKSGKVDAVTLDEPVALEVIHENPELAIADGYLETLHDAFIFPKSSGNEKLYTEFNNYVKRIKSDGTSTKLLNIWQGSDDSLKIVEDYNNLPDTNGTIRLAVDNEAPPFVYVKDGRLTGFDIDVTTRFCREKGYRPVFQEMNFSGIIPSVQSGKSDMSAYTLTITPERSESVRFSEPIYSFGVSLVILKSHDKPENSISSSSDKSPNHYGLSEFDGKKIGVQTGTTAAELVPEKIPSAELSFYESLTDELTALRAGKIDALACSLPAAIYMMNEDSNLEMITPPLRETYLYAMFQNTEKGKKLCDEYSAFLKTLWDNGTIDALNKKWLGSDESKKTLDDYSNLPAVNGSLKFAVDPSLVPFAYVRDNRLIGYDVEIAVMFCKAKGYSLEIQAMSLSALITSVKTGKSDFSCSMNITEERSENTIFSTTPTIKSGNVLVVMKSSNSASVPVSDSGSVQSKNILSFWDDLVLSFQKTFIRENRWLLFAEGIANSMTITVMSIFFGIILGFSVFMACRNGGIIANLAAKFSVWLIKGTPTVVLLMILYYVIFGHVSISGIAVSIMAFTLTFATSVYRMLTFGTGAVDKGQTEAAYALGFTDMQTFFTIVLPQAALHFMPSFKEEVTMLIKSTSIVGYIAVQDLTKMGDIVRSRTYEAFFPLIAVAVIYFIMAGMLNFVSEIIHRRITPSRRKPEDILRGIKPEECSAENPA